MKTLRASKGNTSSGATFWLMAAMRMKDRIGPGIVAVSVEGGGADVGEPASSASGLDPRTAATDETGETTYRPKTATAKIANVRRGRFIGGYLLRTFEPRDNPYGYGKSRLCVELAGVKLTVVEQGLQIQHGHNLSHAFLLFTGSYFRRTISELQIKTT
jgi:hypothetical protein